VGGGALGVAAAKLVAGGGVSVAGTTTGVAHATSASSNANGRAAIGRK
jgi:hypothetical protein